jgi:hypothetical protein
VLPILLAAAFGISVGTLQAYVYLPRPQRLPSIAVAVVLLIGTVSAAWGPGGSTIAGVVIIISAIVAQTLVGGLRLADDPRAEGLGYWERVWLGFTRAGSLRRSPDAPTDARSGK